MNYAIVWTYIGGFVVLISFLAGILYHWFKLREKINLLEQRFNQKKENDERFFRLFQDNFQRQIEEMKRMRKK
ncbi:MAG: hypothetical protein KAU20_01825 [Nanoarchaeota archaeon]|nr:hypothetical protein [Nanoarchaeota archaeon]